MRKVLYVLGELSDSDVEWLIRSGTRQKVEAGETLIRKNEPIDAMYIVLDGQLKVDFDQHSEDDDVMLGTGEILGEMSLVEKGLPTANVIAVDDSIVLAISRDLLDEKLNCGFHQRCSHQASD